MAVVTKYSCLLSLWKLGKVLSRVASSLYLVGPASAEKDRLQQFRLGNVGVSEKGKEQKCQEQVGVEPTTSPTALESCDQTLWAHDTVEALYH